MDFSLDFPYAYSAYLVYIRIRDREPTLNEDQLRIVEQMVIATNVDISDGFTQSAKLVGSENLSNLRKVWLRHIDNLRSTFEMGDDDDPTFMTLVNSGIFWPTMCNTKPNNCVRFWMNFFSDALRVLSEISRHYDGELSNFLSNESGEHQAATAELQRLRQDRASDQGSRLEQLRSRDNPSYTSQRNNYDSSLVARVNASGNRGQTLTQHMQQEAQLFTQVCLVTNTILQVTEELDSIPALLNPENRAQVLGLFWGQLPVLFGGGSQRRLTLHEVLNLCTTQHLLGCVQSFVISLQPAQQIQVEVKTKLDNRLFTAQRVSAFSFLPGAAAASPSPAASVAASPAASVAASPVSSVQSQPSTPVQSQSQPTTHQGQARPGGSKKTRTKRSVHKHKRSVHKHKRSAHKHKRSAHKHKRSAHKHK